MNDNGENLETPADSPSGTITTADPATDNPQGADITGNPEEVEFNSLKGNTQERIKAILKERDEARAQAQRLNQFISSANNYAPAPQYSAPTDPYSNPQVRDAVNQLARVGVATDEKVDQKINQSIGNFIYNFELSKLADELDGSNGMPKFDRSEYEDFINRNPKYQGYDPRDVYEKMYSQEIEDAKLQKAGVRPQTPNTSLRPNRTQVREEQWTPEGINERLAQPDGKQWYISNKDLINRVMSSQS